jgi:hypothetical protein
MGPNGEQARKICEADDNSAFEPVEWSPDGRRLAYKRQYQTPGKSAVSIESSDVKGNFRTTALSEARLQDFYWLADGRLIYTLNEPDPDPDRTSCNFWELQVDELPVGLDGRQQSGCFRVQSGRPMEDLQATFGPGYGRRHLNRTRGCRGPAHESGRRLGSLHGFAQR